MATLFNKVLHDAAAASALRHSSMPVFLCDADFRLCMQSISLPEILSVSTGRKMEKLFPTELSDRLRQMEEGCIVAELQLACAERIAFIVVGYHLEQRYYAVILNSLQINPAFRQSDVFNDMLHHVSATVRDMLNTPESDTTRLLLSCQQLQRMYHYAKMSYEDSIFLTRQTAEFVPLLNDVIDGFAHNLAAMGGKITVMESSARCFFINCSPMCYGSILSVLITAAVMASENGEIVIQCHDDLTDCDCGTVTIAIPQPSQTLVIDSIDALVTSLPMLRIDLIIARELAAWRNIRLSCRRVNRLLAFDISIPYTDQDRVTLHSPTITREQIQLNGFIHQLCCILRADWADAL